MGISVINRDEESNRKKVVRIIKKRIRTTKKGERIERSDTLYCYEKFTKYYINIQKNVFNGIII